MSGIKNGTSDSKSQSRITWGSKVATGFDRLKIGFYVSWENETFLNLLAAAKESAKEINDVYPVSFSEHGDLVFNCHTTGRKGGYGFHLSRCDVHIFFSTRKGFETPNVWVDIGSESCWSPGYRAVVSEIRNMIEGQGGYIVKDSISEVHLCSDWIGLDIEELPIDQFEFWVCRANYFNTYHNHHGLLGVNLSQEGGDLSDDITGIEFGRGDIMLRIYDKTKEICRSPSKQAVFASVWDQANYDDDSVTRVEFQLRRPVLKQMKINTYSDLEKRKGDIWRYCTYDWCRLSDHAIDRNNRHQDRASLHPWWQELHSLEITGSGEFVKREYPRASKDLDVLMDLVGGCVLSVGTILNRKFDDLEGVITMGQAAIESKLRKMWTKRDEKTGKREFEYKMKKRWAEIWPMGYERMAVIQ